MATNTGIARWQNVILWTTLIVYALTAWASSIPTGYRFNSSS